MIFSPKYVDIYFIDIKILYSTRVVIKIPHLTNWKKSFHSTSNEKLWI